MQTDLFSLSNRVAIVTGSARGLGQALAEGLAREGARVVVCDLNQEGARATADRIRAAGGEAVSTCVDVADAESCNALVRFAAEQLGRVDVLVNNAGIDIAEPVGEVTEEVWSKILDVNLKGVLNASQSAIHQMRAQGGGGSIINISSIAGLVAMSDGLQRRQRRSPPPHPRDGAGACTRKHPGQCDRSRLSRKHHGRHAQRACQAGNRRADPNADTAGPARPPL
jgi:NAD(P)-dependent dehydrogenase (short-subunit alcohol dehydrogenase family)